MDILESELVTDIIMPPIGLLLGGIDFTAFAVTLKAASRKVPLPPVQGTSLGMLPFPPKHE